MTQTAMAGIRELRTVGSSAANWSQRAPAAMTVWQAQGLP